MSTTEWQQIVARLRGYGITVVEVAGCYGRSNGLGWAAGKPVGHTNHHYVCSLNPSQDYIDSLVSNLAAGTVVNWFADVNGKAYLIGTGPMNHAGTGNSGVLNRTKADQPNLAVAGSAGDMSGNTHYSGTECQHPGDDTPWPEPMLETMFAINAAEFAQWGYSANRAINHYAWTNRKIDMSWLGGVDSGSAQGQALVDNVQRYLDGDSDMPLSDSDKAWIEQAMTDAVDERIRAHLGEPAVSNPNAALNAGIMKRTRADDNKKMAGIPGYVPLS